MQLPFELTQKDIVIICGDMGLLWADDREFAYYKKVALCAALYYIVGTGQS